MSPEIQSALIGGAAGAVLAYTGGWLQSVLDRRRQRHAVATAILCEMPVAEDFARLLQKHEEPGAISAHVPTSSMERFIEYAALFKPSTVAEVMDLVRHTADLQRELIEPIEARARQVGRDDWMRRVAQVTLGDVARVRPLLIEEGGQHLTAAQRGIAQLPPSALPRLGP